MFIQRAATQFQLDLGHDPNEGGDPTPEQQAMYKTLDKLVTHPKTMIMRVTHNDPSITIGSSKAGIIDVGDMKETGTGNPPNAHGTLGHEMNEIYAFQIVRIKDYETAHPYWGVAAENRITGWQRDFRSDSHDTGYVERDAAGNVLSITGSQSTVYTKGNRKYRADVNFIKGNVVDVKRTPQ